MLENGVCAYPKLEGRFLQVSGISFAFDAAKPPNQRVDPRFIRVGDQYLEPDAKYRLVTKEYLHAGKDGFDVLKNAKVLVSNCILSFLILVYHACLLRLTTRIQLRSLWLYKIIFLPSTKYKRSKGK